MIDFLENLPQTFTYNVTSRYRFPPICWALAFTIVVTVRHPPGPARITSHNGRHA